MRAEDQELILTVEGGVATLTLNRPNKLNALTPAMYSSELLEVVRRVKDDDDVKVLVITGAGRGFCSGADVTQGAPTLTSRKEKIQPIGAAVLELANLDKPVIAAVNGVAVGAGLSLALLCDIRIASDQAKFGAVWVKRGIIPDLGCTWLLPRLVGIERAILMTVTGDLIDAQEALRIGLVSQVVPHEELTKVVYQLAGRIAAGPSMAIELTKRGIYQGLQNDLKAQLHYESYAQHTCMGTEDSREGGMAFRERRDPAFKGK